MKKYGALVVFFVCLFSTTVNAKVNKYIIILKSKPVVKVETLNLKSQKAVNYKAKIELEQTSLSNFVKSELKGRVKGQVKTVLNAIFVEIDDSKLEQLKTRPEVKSISIDEVHKLFIDAARQVHKLDRAITKINKNRSTIAQGLKIAIIDTGVNIDNPMFDDTNFQYPEGFDPGVDNYADFTNNKVIVAKVFSSSPNPDDKRGHGTSVASCAAGNSVAISSNGVDFQLQGSAAGAYIGNYKVFPDFDSGAQASSIIAAINAAVEDGMDVLNLSLGSIPGGSATGNAEVIAIENAVVAGSIVVVAAGNDGEYNSTNTSDTTLYGKVYQQTIGSPSVAPNCITVAATTNGRFWSTTGNISAEGESIDSSLENFLYGKDTKTAANLNETFGPFEVVDITSLGVDELGCSDFGSVDLTGKVAFIKRGDCAFAQKMLNAQNVGAVGALIYDHTQVEFPMGMTIADTYTTLTIPGFMIRKSEGEKLKLLLASAENPVFLTIDPTTITKIPKPQGYKTSFSSTGPTKFDYTLKPDVSVTGELIVAAAPSQEGEAYSYGIAGTSFSSPLTAGYMAVLKSHFPSLTPAELKGIICATADLPLNYFQIITGTSIAPVYTYYKKNGVAAPIATGAGKVNMENAVSAKITPLPNSLSFGKTSISASDSGTLTKSVTLKNISDETVTLYPKLLKILDNTKATASLSSLEPIVINSGETGSATLNVSYQGEVNSWVQGYVIFESNNGASYTVPYYAWISSPLLDYSSTSDIDGDGLNKTKEYTLGTDLFVKDTDGDGFNDGDELNVYKTDPANATDYPTNVPSYNNKVYVPFSSTEYADSSDTKTEVYVVNEGETETEVIVKFFTDLGALSSQPLTKTINSKGFAVFSPTNNLYPAHIGWVEVESASTVKVAATVYFLGNDGEVKSSYAIPGTSSLTTKAYVPHIAEQVNQWKTYLSIANPGNSDISANFTTGAGDSVSVAGFGTSMFSNKYEIVSNLFGGNFPSIPSQRENWWGSLTTENTTGFSAVEFFEQTNETSKIYQVGGLLLDDRASTEIVIPHVETQWLWWTGLALNNPNTASATITVTPFDAEGTQLETSTFSLAAGKKYVNLVQGFWTDNGLEYPTATAWLKVTSDNPITGFALFGLMSGDPEADNYVDDLAAIEPIMDYSSELMFPYVIYSSSENSQWSGIGLINAGNENAQVTLTGYNAHGEVAGTSTLTLNAKQKLVKLVDGSLITNLSKDVKWIKVTSDKPIAGFELFGGTNHKYLNGIPAL